MVTPDESMVMNLRSYVEHPNFKKSEEVHCNFISVDSNFVHRHRAGVLLDESMAFISAGKNGGELICVVQQVGLLSSL